MLPVWTQVIGTSLAHNFAHVNGNRILIVGEKGTLPVSVASHDNSILYRRPLKYKMATISALNPMQSPEKILVGAIKQHAAMMSSSTTDLPSFHSHLLSMTMEELRSRCYPKGVLYL